MGSKRSKVYSLVYLLRAEPVAPHLYPYELTFSSATSKECGRARTRVAHRHPRAWEPALLVLYTTFLRCICRTLRLATAQIRPTPHDAHAARRTGRADRLDHQCAHYEPASRRSLRFSRICFFGT